MLALVPARDASFATAIRGIAQLLVRRAAVCTLNFDTRPRESAMGWVEGNRYNSIAPPAERQGWLAVALLLAAEPAE